MNWAKNDRVRAVFVDEVKVLEKDLGSLQHRGDEALPLTVAGANSNLKHSMIY